MKEFKFVTQFKELKSTLSKMTYKEKLAHLWAYYKWVLVVILCVIMLTSVLVTSCQNRRSNVIVGGIALNLDISDAGENYLSNGYKEFIGSESKRDRVSFNDDGMLSAVPDMDNYYSLQSVLALVAGKDLDYVIADQVALEVLLNQEVIADLSTIYTAAELEALGDLVIYYQAEEGGSKVPVAINIQNTAFIQENTNAKDMVFFIYITNSDRVEQTKNLLEYLKDWQAKK